MLLQGMEGGWVVIEASHTVRSGLNVTYHMLMYINGNSQLSTGKGWVLVAFCSSGTSTVEH